MKLFTQLALVSAIAVSGNAMAMQALDDAQLSNTTGRDGITLTIKPPTKSFTPVGGTAAMMGVINIDSIYVHDKSGWTDPSPTATHVAGAGAITLDGFAIAGNQPIVVKIDADGNTAGTGGAFLNVNVALPSTLIIRTGEIGVAASNRNATNLAAATDPNTVRGIAGTSNKILDSIDVKLGGAKMNIQLGNEVQGAMIKVSGEVANGLVISGVTLEDKAGTAANLSVGQLGKSGGEITIQDIVVTDNGDLTKLTLATDIDVSANGLVMTLGGTKTDVLMTNVVLGNVAAVAGTNFDSTGAIGDVEIVGLDMIGAQIAVSGH
jgi:hypothetical protein